MDSHYLGFRLPRLLGYLIVIGRIEIFSKCAPKSTLHRSDDHCFSLLGLNFVVHMVVSFEAATAEASEESEL